MNGSSGGDGTVSLRPYFTLHLRLKAEEGNTCARVNECRRIGQLGSDNWRTETVPRRRGTERSRGSGEEERAAVRDYRRRGAGCPRGDSVGTHIDIALHCDNSN